MIFATGLTGGLRPINTAYLPTVDSVVENIVVENIVVVYRQSITTPCKLSFSSREWLLTELYKC
jgi:hypothetical protein